MALRDKNGVEIVEGCWVWSAPEGETERVILVTEVTFTEEGAINPDMGVEVLPLSDQRIRDFFRVQGGFTGGGGSFGGGGASGSW